MSSTNSSPPIRFSSIDVAKNARQLAQPSGFGFSPDDQTLAYISAAPQASPDTRFLHVLRVGAEPTISRLEPLVEIHTDDKELTLEEKLRRERQRVQTVGILSHAWCATGNKMLVPCQSTWYSVDPDAELPFTTLIETSKGSDPALDACFTPNGEHVVFVRGKDLWISSSSTTAATAKAIRLSEPPSTASTITNGVASFLAQEEMDRSHGFWVSPDGKFVAYEHVDEMNVPEFVIANDKESEVYHYPFAGEENPKIQLRLANIQTALAADAENRSPPTTLVLNLSHGLFDHDEESYMARVDWWPDGSLLLVQVENRRQNELVLLGFDPHTGARSVLLRENSKAWINLHYLLVPFAHDGKKYFLWGSERSGFQHLYLYWLDMPTVDEARACTATLVRPITSGDWVVDTVVGVDETNAVCLFMGNLDNPMEKHMYAVDITPGEVGSGNGNHVYTRLTPAKGTHSCVVDHRFKHVVMTRSTLQQLPVSSLCRLPDLKKLMSNSSHHVVGSNNEGTAPPPPPATGNAKRQRVDDTPIPAMEVLYEFENAWDASSATTSGGNNNSMEAMPVTEIIKMLRPPTVEQFTQTPSGHTLYCHLFLPNSAHYRAPFPTICIVYGGPHVQRVKDEWASTYDLRAHRFTQMGYAVVKIDNRGSARRGIEFESALRHRMGDAELEDQIFGLQQLSERGIVDAKRIGITGWSYGGYLSAMAILKYPEVFKVAVAGAPVTHWDGYDTHYTERYMGTPQDNPVGYQTSSCMEYAQNLSGHLLLVHGLIDENVHYRMTTRLVSALIRHRKKFDLLCFPDERHSPLHMENRIYLEDRFVDYFSQL